MIAPNKECQDFERLKNDIEKYYRGSALFTEDIKEEWVKLVDDSSEYYQVNSSPEWLFSTLSGKKDISEAPRELEENEGVAIAQRIHEIDFGAVPQVNVF